MAIKKKFEVTYTTDTGREMELGDMTPSHLMNAIAHHQKQVVVLSDLITGEFDDAGNLKHRRELLLETISLLGKELALRHPSFDDGNEDEEANDSFHRRPYGSHRRG